MKSKGNKKNLFSLLSVFASIFIYMGAVGVYFYANGWRIDPSKQLFIKTGVLNVQSDPILANLYINGEAKGRTPKSVSLKVGTYDVSLYRSGYVEWRKEIEIKEEKSTPVFPWLIKDDIVGLNLTLLQGKEYINSWSNESTDHIYFLTKEYVSPNLFRYSLYRFDVNTTFWDLNSNPRTVLTFDSSTAPEIQLQLSPSGILGVMTMKDGVNSKQYLLDSSKSSTLDTLTELDLSPFSSYTMTWAKNNQYLIFDSEKDLISFDIQKQNRYLLLQKEENQTYLWSTDEQGYFYTVQTNTDNTDENIYSYILVQELMDGSSPKLLIQDLFFQKNKEYIQMYKEDTGIGKYAPFTNSPQSTKSVGLLKKFIVNQNTKGIYLETDTSSYWYNITTRKYHLISPYPCEFVQFAPDNYKLIFKDTQGYNIFTFQKDDGDHTVEIGSKEIKGVDGNSSNVTWISNSLYVWYVKDNKMYIADKDGDNTIQILEDIDILKYFVITISRDKVFTLYTKDALLGLQDIYIDSYLLR